MTADEIQLLAIRAGDSQAFAWWLAGAEPSLRRALRRFAAAVDVEAVLQEALLRVWQAAPELRDDGRPEVLLRFAHVTARNLAFSEARRLRVAPDELAALERAAAEAESAPAPRPVDPLLRAAIAKCREKLPGKPRQALDARLQSQGGDEDGTLAAQLGMKLNTFLQNFTRARKLLAECLKKAGVDLALELSP